MSMKILITGGHLSPALTLIDSLKQKKQVLLVYVGKKYDSQQSLSLEYKEIKKRNVLFYHLSTGRLTRIFNFQLVVNALKIPLGILRAFYILIKEKPNLVFNFGSYLGFPVGIVAILLKIPLYTHEQTIHPGLTNRILGKFSKKIFVAFEESRKFFPAEKTIVTGNLIKPSIFKILKKPFEIKKNKPVIYITGGSLGSHSINLIIEKILPLLKKEYLIIHQTGGIKKFNDYERLKKFADQSYYPKKHFFDNEIGYVYSIADIIISRAGANTFFELIALKKPAILIPLPWSAYQEQEKHAQLFTRYQLGFIFHQEENPEKLILLIQQLLNKYQFYRNNFSKLPINLKLNAAEKIIQEIF